MRLDHSNCDHDATKAARARCRTATNARRMTRIRAAQALIDSASASWDPAWGRRSILTIAARISTPGESVILPFSRQPVPILPTDPSRRYTPNDEDVYVAAIFLTDRDWDFRMICHALS